VSVPPFIPLQMSEQVMRFFHHPMNSAAERTPQA
jgi:hypothetical protein